VVTTSADGPKRTRCDTCRKVAQAGYCRRYYDANRRVAEPYAPRTTACTGCGVQLAIARRGPILHANKQKVRRARKCGAPQVVPIDRMAIYRRDLGRCHLCRRRVKPDRFHVDHLIPLARGGSHVPENVAIAHPLCNMRKSAKLVPVQVPLSLPLAVFK
jgi:5-methylcytosine-specific restriction endonuclease McrA